MADDKLTVGLAIARLHEIEEWAGRVRRTLEGLVSEKAVKEDALLDELGADRVNDMSKQLLNLIPITDVC